MPVHLNVTNGDVVADLLMRGGVPGERLPWRDVLHEGPTPSGLSLEEMGQVRARFLYDSGWTPSLDRVLQDIRQRNDVLRGFKRYEEIALWFEHDLYDQLQLLQVLHWLGMRETAGTRLTLICINEYPGVDDFRGLGQLTPDQLAGLRENRIEVGEEQFSLGRRGWECFTSPDPSSIERLMRQDLSPLPFLRAALRRHLEQFPSTRDGLARSERQTLSVLKDGGCELRELFSKSQIEMESAPFMSDTAFLLTVERMLRPDPLVEFEEEEPEATQTRLSITDPQLWERRVRLTEAGRKVVCGQTDRTRFQPVDRHLGGVRLDGHQPSWRWDPMAKQLQAS